MVKFHNIFGNKPIIGMLHLAGNSKQDKIRRVLDELAIYEIEGVDGAIVEDYHGNVNDVVEVLKGIRAVLKFSKYCPENGLNVVIGVNVLSNPYEGFKFAQDFGAKFVQFDSVQTKDLDLELYSKQRSQYPEIAVLGGVGFKYIAPTGNPLEVDLREGIGRCEAIVTTGSGTGIETPTSKLREFKSYLGDFPLIVGAGLNLANAYEQLSVADGAIVGSCFKPDGNTYSIVDRKKVRDLMDIVKGIRG